MKTDNSTIVTDYRETAAKFQKEWQVQAPHRHFDFAAHVKNYALVSVLNKGLVYEDLERQFFESQQVCVLSCLYFIDASRTKHVKFGECYGLPMSKSKPLPVPRGTNNYYGCRALVMWRKSPTLCRSASSGHWYPSRLIRWKIMRRKKTKWRQSKRF